MLRGCLASVLYPHYNKKTFYNMKKYFDKQLYETVIHELGHAICAISIDKTKHPTIIIENTIGRIAGHTIFPKNEGGCYSPAVISAGYIMESLSLNRNIVRHNGTDKQKLNLICPSKDLQHRFEDIAKTILTPYKEKVELFAKNIVSSIDPYTNIDISYSMIFDLMQQN